MDKPTQSPLTFTNKMLIAMIVPAILNDLLGRMVGIVDSVMVSSVGEVAVSAVSLTNSLYLVFSHMISAFAVGAGVLFAQYLGSRDQEKGESTVKHSFWLALYFALAVALTVIPLAGPLMWLFFPGVSPDIWESGVLCLQMYIGSLPFYAIEQICIYIFISMGKNKQVLYINLGKNFANIAGNALFIYGFRWGLFGALLSTLLSHAIFCVLAVCLLHNKELPLHFTKLLPPRLNKEQTRLIFKVSSVTIVERALFQAGNLLCSSMTAGFSAAEIAANSVSRDLVSLGWFVGFAFATTLSSVVGRCIGADQPKQAKFYTKRLVLAGFGVTTVVFTLIFLFRQPMVSMYDLAGSTKALSADYVGLGCLLTVFGGHAIVVTFSSAFRAAGDLRFVTTTALASMFLCQVSLSYIFVFAFDLGVTGIWLGLGADWLGRSILYTVHFCRGKWLAKKVI